jgi:hypothetical protein
MIIFIVSLVIVGCTLQWWSIRHGLDGVSHTYSPSESIVEPGDVFNIDTTIKNSSFRFISYIQIIERIPSEFEIIPPGGNDYSMFLMPRRCYNRSIAAKATKRGCYFLCGASLIGGGFLGINETFKTISQHREVVVIPPPYEGLNIKDTVGGFLGDISVNRFIMEDPVLTMGFREYTGREPFKMIAWNQSARNRRLMVKKYDYTLEMVVTVILNVEFRIDDAYTEGIFEECLSMARTVCETLEKEHIKYSFITNAYTTGAISHWDRITDGLGSKHLLAILEGLGRASYGYAGAFHSIMSKALKNAEQGRSHIIIMPQFKDKYRQSILHLKNLTGGRVLVLTPGEEMVI